MLSEIIVGRDANGDERVWRKGQTVYRRRRPMSPADDWVKDQVRICFGVNLFFEPYLPNMYIKGAVLMGVPWALTTELLPDVSA